MHIGNLRKLHLTEFPEPDWVFKDFIKKGDQVLLSGRTGEGKSLVTMLMSVAMARGEPFGALICPKSLTILYLDAENDMYSINKRIRRVKSNEGLENIKYWYGAEDEETIDINDKDDRAYLLSVIADKKPDVVVIDNVFSMSLCEDYNATQEYQTNFKPLILELKRQKICGIYIHHLNKRDEEYGSIAMKLFMDMCLKLTKEEDIYTFEVSKSRGFQISDDDLSFTISDDNEVSHAVVEVKEGSKQHYLTFLANNWSKKTGSYRDKIKELRLSFERDFKCSVPLKDDTVRTYYVPKF
ncbi:AAA family ATPase [Gammaproteobacteria bacterium]|nr:AAA family ATPase [Gammaproteobacteria bacterium]